jgi:hypothetical protein
MKSLGFTLLIKKKTFYISNKFYKATLKIGAILIRLLQYLNLGVCRFLRPVYLP